MSAHMPTQLCVHMPIHISTHVSMHRSTHKSITCVCTYAYKCQRRPARPYAPLTRQAIRTTHLPGHMHHSLARPYAPLTRQAICTTHPPGHMHHSPTRPYAPLTHQAICTSDAARDLCQLCDPRLQLFNVYALRLALLPPQQSIDMCIHMCIDMCIVQ